MTYVVERGLLATPLLTYTTTVVAWPGEDFTPPTKTGNPSSPASFVEVLWDHTFSDDLTFGSEVERRGVIEHRIYVEDVGIGDLRHWQIVDALMTAYATDAAGGALYFMRGEAYPSALIHEENGWTRMDWVLPFRRFEVQS